MWNFKTYSRYSQRFENSDKQEWRVATATVVVCRRSFRSFFEAGTVHQTGGPATPTDYVTTFEYEVEGKKYFGKARRGTPVKPGHCFSISYDPNHPSSNTGSDNQGPWWFRLILGLMVLASVSLLIYFDHLMKS
jgi:hypothetical protein